MESPPIVDLIRAAALEARALVPVHAHFGVRAVSAEIGRVEVAQAMGSHCLDPYGRLSPGAFLVGADAALGAAVASRLPDRLSVVSLTLRMEFVRLQPAGAEDFLIRGRVAHIGDNSGFAQGEIISDAGDIIAFLSTHCAFAPNHAEGPAGPGFPIDRSLGRTAHDGNVLGPLATVRAGVRLTQGDDGAVRLVASPTPELRNSRGDVQGGVLGMLAEQAVTACLIRSTPAVARADAMELSVTYVRPLRSERPDIEVMARPEHAGRRFAAAHAVGYDSSGRVVITASGSRYHGGPT